MADFIDYIMDGNLFQSPHQTEWYSNWLGGKEYLRKNIKGFYNRTMCRRTSLCVAGKDYEKVMYIKHALHKFTSNELVIESLHYKNDNDLLDGALLAHKVLLVGTFQAGRRLLDDEGDGGQLDAAYDEVFLNHGDLMVVYMNLPSLIYPLHPHPHLYHPLMSTLIFPQQPLVKTLADNDLFLTLNEKFPHFNAPQQECIKKWIEKQPESYGNIYAEQDFLNATNALKNYKIKDTRINYGKRREQRNKEDEEEEENSITISSSTRENTPLIERSNPSMRKTLYGSYC